MSRTAAVGDSPQTSEGQAWWFLDTLVVEHLTASGTGPVVLEMTLPAGAAPPLHLHHDLDDSSFLLDGQMMVRCGDQALLAGAGDWLSMPRGVPHASGWWATSLPASCWCTTTTASRSSYETWASPPVLGNCPLPQAVPASRSCPGRWPSTT
jgi:uncharacterized RmlC-like cupin family protein